MKIILVGNFRLDRQESMLRFESLLAQGLRARGHQVEVWSPEPVTARLFRNYRYDGVAKYFGYFDKFVAFPARVRRRLTQARLRPDLVHIVDHANAVYGPLFRGLPLLGTCHDLLQIRAARGEFPEQRLTARGKRYQEWILRHIAGLPHVVCCSEQTARDLHRLAHVPAVRTEVIPIGLNHPYQPLSDSVARKLVAAALAERGLPPDLLERSDRGFILNVGGGQWYKNRAGLIETYAHLRSKLRPFPRLVMVGKPLSPELAARAHSLGIGENLVSLQNLSNAQLNAFYALAECLFFPSWHEGFGWPVAEAQASGCPVITSQRSPMTEVGGSAAEYVNPGDPRGAATHIAEFWPRRKALIPLGLARAVEWNPDRMIERYAERYEALTFSTPAVSLS